MGRTLFSRSLFAQAAACFDKAHRVDYRNMASAYQKRKDARSLALGKARLAAFKVAASEFEACAKGAAAGSQALRHRAAECYVEAGEFACAGVNFEAAERFTDAAVNYHKAQLFDDATRLVRPPDGTLSFVEQPIRDRLLDNIKLQYLRLNDLGSVISFHLI